VRNDTFNVAVTNLEFMSTEPEATVLFDNEFESVWNEVQLDKDADRREAQLSRLRKLALLQCSWLMVQYHKAKQEHDEAQAMNG